jgi:hypothetical protein
MYSTFKEDKYELGYVLEKMIKGLRNETNTVLLKTERSRDMPPEAQKNMMKN